jgi:hypothetical protein
MPSNHTVELRTPSGTQLDEVWVTFGAPWSQTRDRPIRDGQGFSIELPAVLDLLEAVVAGDEKAADVRDALHVALGEAAPVHLGAHTHSAALTAPALAGGRGLG